MFDLPRETLRSRSNEVVVSQGKLPYGAGKKQKHLLS